MVLLNSQNADSDVRFTDLLQPIRDLTKNWNIDIAGHLEEYLSEIGRIAITFDGGASTLNFAQAALIIQGSACVYSKKVEYLYSLVYQVLDLLASKKKLQQSPTDGDNENTDDAGRNRRNEDDEFLILDDIRVNKNITLKTDDVTSDEGVTVVPRTPMALVPKDDAEKGENPLLSHKGEILGSRNDFKMNTCCIHPSGTQLLDLSHLSLLDVSFRNLITSTPFPQKRVDVDVNADVPCPEVEAEPPQQPMDISVDDNDGGLDFPEMEDPLPPGLEVGQGEGQPQETNKDQQEQVRRSERTRPKPVFLPPTKPAVDPWEALDPHKADAVAEKPFKKRKTFRLPPCLESEATRKRKRQQVGKDAVPRRVTFTEFCATAYNPHPCKYPKNPLQVPAFPEFEQLYWAEQKRRQARMKEDRRKMYDQGRLEEVLAIQAAEDEEDNEPHGLDVDDDDNLDLPGEIQIPDIDDLGPMNPEVRDLEDMLRYPEESGNVAGAVEGDIVNSYEELVRQHVEGFLTSAQQYAQITELSKRVAEWEDRIVPKLEEDELHGPFDIHEYGTRVLDQLKDPRKADQPMGEEESRILPFRKVAENKPAYEVCRLFLASLQLANNYNIEIESSGVLEAGVDTMTIKLLSTRRHFDELVDYRAPSIEH